MTTNSSLTWFVHKIYWHPTSSKPLSHKTTATKSTKLESSETHHRCKLITNKNVSLPASLLRELTLIMCPRQKGMEVSEDWNMNPTRPIKPPPILPNQHLGYRTPPHTRRRHTCSLCLNRSTATLFPHLAAEPHERFIFMLIVMIIWGLPRLSQSGKRTVTFPTLVTTSERHSRAGNAKQGH